MSEKCDNISEKKIKCSRRAVFGTRKCKRHTQVQEICPICQDPLDDNYPLACGHCFHRECLKGLRQFSCPMCRAKIEAKFLPSYIRTEIKKHVAEDSKERDLENQQAAESLNLGNIHFINVNDAESLIGFILTLVSGDERRMASAIQTNIFSLSGRL
jgi:hypothetical protein